MYRVFYVLQEKYQVAKMFEDKGRPTDWGELIPMVEQGDRYAGGQMGLSSLSCQSRPNVWCS